MSHCRIRVSHKRSELGFRFRDSVVKSAVLIARRVCEGNVRRELHFKRTALAFLSGSMVSDAAVAVTRCFTTRKCLGLLGSSVLID